VRLLLFHPGVARIDCEDCKRWIYDLETGKRKTYRSGPEREEKDQVRPKGVPTPCDKCAKGSPKKAEECQLSVRNYRTLALHSEVRATAGACLSKRARRDRLLLWNLAIVDGLVREWERKRAAEELANQVAMLYKR